VLKEVIILLKQPIKSTKELIVGKSSKATRKKLVSLSLAPESKLVQVPRRVKRKPSPDLDLEPKPIVQD